MKTVIYYFSGTGNSLAVAKALAKNLDGMVDLLPIAGSEKEQSVEINGDLLGLVFPVYFLSMPDIVRCFLKKLKFKSNPYIFAVTTCNGQSGNSLYSLDKLLKNKGKSLAAGFDLIMPGNALIGKVDKTNPPEVQKTRLDNVTRKLSLVAETIKERRNGIIEGSNSQKTYIRKFLLTALIKNLYRPSKRFLVLDNCNHCGTCVRICPTQNINLNQERKPVWGEHCELCLACLHWCPQKAINLEAHTIGKIRYHHPEVTADELFIKPTS